MEAHTIKFPELFKTARSFTIVCKGRRCGEVIKIRRWSSGPSHLVFLLVYGRHIGCICRHSLVNIYTLLSSSEWYVLLLRKPAHQHCCRSRRSRWRAQIKADFFFSPKISLENWIFSSSEVVQLNWESMGKLISSSVHTCSSFTNVSLCRKKIHACFYIRTYSAPGVWRHFFSAHKKVTNPKSTWLTDTERQYY